MNDDRIYTIGEVSAICNIPIKTLRYYDDIGLVVPNERSHTGNYRLYRENQILELFVIRKLKLLDFPLKEIKMLVNDVDVDTLQASIEKQLSLIRQDLERLQNKYTEGSLLLERFRKGHVVLNDARQRESQDACDMEDIPETDVIFTRKVQSDYNNADVSIDRWAEVIDLAEKNALSAAGAIVLIYHTEPLGQFYQTDCDLEVCLQVDRALDLPFHKKHGGFRAVTATHVGSHDTIYNTHIQAIKWIKKNKLKITGPISEEYIISPMDIWREDTYISKVIIPVEPHTDKR